MVKIITPMTQIVLSKKKNNYIDKLDFKVIEDLKKQGKNTTQIAKHLGIPVSNFFMLMKRRNFEIGNKHRKVQKIDNYFNTIDSEFKAYILGFIVADGCVYVKSFDNSTIKSIKKLRIDISIKDEYILKTIQTNICNECKIVQVQRKNSMTSVINIYSDTIVDDLIKYNILPNKTKHTSFKFDFEVIPEVFHHHFIRGFFDGDGHVNNGAIEMVFTSPLFLNQVKSWFESKIEGITSNIIIRNIATQKTYHLFINLGYDKRIKVFNVLYENANYYLDRKYNVFVEAIKNINNDRKN